jgi:hypothetical protein
LEIKDLADPVDPEDLVDVDPADPGDADPVDPEDADPVDPEDVDPVDPEDVADAVDRVGVGGRTRPRTCVRT